MITKLNDPTIEVMNPSRKGPMLSRIRGDSRDQLYKTSDKFDLLDI